MNKMKSPLSPSDIEVLLHCYSCPSQHPRRHAPAVEEAFEMFEGCGMIVRTDETYEGYRVWRTTDKGAFFVDKLCNMQEPIPYFK